MGNVDRLSDAVKEAGPRPAEDSAQSTKKNYSEKLSNTVALALADELRRKGVAGCLPDKAGGKERRFAGGIGAKKVDVSFATPEAGLLLGISVKTICFRDKKSRTYQKNLPNRRNDILSEAVTLHLRFPFAVLGGLLLFHDGAAEDGTGKRSSTFQNAAHAFRQFARRDSTATSPEAFERFVVGLFSPAPKPRCELHLVERKTYGTISLEAYLDLLLAEVAVRNADHFDFADGKLAKA